jgi:tetratricopeptide (TPR) repeat protein
MGIIQESMGKLQDALMFYKKSLKTKFNYYGENNEEVLELQYKISCVLMNLKKYKEAEEIMNAMTEVVFREKLAECETDNMYRYGVYFYTAGIIFMKNNKFKIAKQHLKKAKNLWKDILHSSDPCLISLDNFLKLVEN